MISDTDIQRIREILERSDAGEAIVISIMAKEYSDQKVTATQERFILK